LAAISTLIVYLVLRAAMRFGIIRGAGVVFNTEIVNYELEHRVSRNMREDGGYNCICMVACCGQVSDQGVATYHTTLLQSIESFQQRHHTAGVGQGKQAVGSNDNSWMSLSLTIMCLRNFEQLVEIKSLISRVIMRVVGYDSISE
jgi:hypothetical protein